MKKLISLVLSVLFLFLPFTFCTSVSSAQAPVLEMESVSAHSGEDICLNLIIKNNPGIAGLTVSLVYDKEILFLKEVKNGNLFSGFDMAENLSWDESCNVTEDGILATIKFGVKENVELKEYPVEFTVRGCVNDVPEDVVCSITQGKISVVKTPVPVTGVYLDKTEATVKAGESATLVPIYAPEDASNKEVTWSSSDDSIASVVGGVVTGVKEGTATITVTTADSGYQASCVVTVSARTPIMRGDTDGDGSVTILDALDLFKDISGKQKLTGDAAIAGDVNGDNSITILDAVAIFKHVAGKEIILNTFSASGSVERSLSGSSVQTGDVNQDLVTDSADLALLRKYIANYDYDNQSTLYSVGPDGDANGDGKTDITDMVLLRKYFAGNSIDSGASAAGCTVIAKAMAFNKIVCWGDSLTQNGGWIERLGKSTGLAAYNCGIGGERCTDIMARQGVDPIVLQGITIPGDSQYFIIGNVADGLTTRDGNTVKIGLQSNNGINSADIGGVKGYFGSLFKDGVQKYFFKRSVAGEPLVLDKPTELKTYSGSTYSDGSALTVIMMGANGGYSGIDDLIEKHRRMIEHSKSENYLILGGLTVGNNVSLAIYENKMKEAFGDRYISMREYFAADAMADAGLTPTEKDLQCMAKGETPPSLLADTIHWNKTCQDVAGRYIYKKICELGWE